MISFVSALISTFPLDIVITEFEPIFATAVLPIVFTPTDAPTPNNPPTATPPMVS